MLDPTNSLEDSDWELPDHTIVEMAPRAHDICVVIPVLDEGERILRQLARMRASCSGVDIIVADGNSTDGYSVPEKLGPLNVRVIVRKLGPGGLSSQMRAAYAYALRQGYRGIVQIDGNDKDGVEAIPNFVRHLEAGGDCVLGSRYMPGGTGIRTPLVRDLGIRLVHAPLISLAAGRRMTDTTNGFRAFSRRYLLDPRVKPFRHVFKNYNLPYYLAVRAARLRYRVIQIPVVRYYPERGPTPTKIMGLKGYLGILGELFRTVMGSYDIAPEPEGRVRERAPRRAAAPMAKSSHTDS
jgi:dolichol-phosphate mannosyltransferase